MRETAVLVLFVWIAASLVCCSNNDVESEVVALPGGTFKNPIADYGSADPNVVFKDGYYYFTYTTGGDVTVRKSRTLNFKGAAQATVWKAVRGTNYSDHVWAPELKFLQGKWYIYFSASNPDMDTHRMYVLEADTEDPLGFYTFRGQITDSTDKWGIDETVLELNESLYLVWSGWEGDHNIQQNIYIAPMSDPLTVSGPRALLSQPEYDWEKAGGPPYINEGPAILQKNGKTFIIYSGAGSWTADYALGMLMLDDAQDPLVAANWHKSEKPLFSRNDEAGVFGPGHNSFTVSPDGTEDWLVYHANGSPTDGWANRIARAQPVHWNEDGTPEFGKPLSLDTPIPIPSGQGRFYTENAEPAEDGGFHFTEIPSDHRGETQLTIAYHSAGKSASTYEINASYSIQQLELPGTSGEQGSVVINTALNKGQNFVTLTKLNGDAIIDFIQLPN